MLGNRANGIIGSGMMHNEVMSGVTEVLAYGTAVLLEKQALNSFYPLNFLTFISFSVRVEQIKLHRT
jgi:hypothetical protein